MQCLQGFLGVGAPDGARIRQVDCEIRRWGTADRPCRPTCRIADLGSVWLPAAALSASDTKRTAAALEAACDFSWAMAAWKSALLPRKENPGVSVSRRARAMPHRRNILPGSRWSRTGRR